MTTTEVTIKNICPVIGMISSGKSSILNALFNMDYLEAKPQVTTKIVTIIRHKPTLTKPKFYQLILKNDGNGNYTFHKDNNSEINGKEEIRTKIGIINEKLHKIEPVYEEIFYMLEVGEVNFIQESFLKNNDLADVPGVSEAIKHIDPNNPNDSAAPKPTDTEEDQNIEQKDGAEKREKEISYLTQIFKILKNKMNNGIIIFSIDKYENKENYSIIRKLKQVLEKPIENYLVLLNKMDTSKNIEADISKLNEKFAEYFPGGEFNATRNTIVPCCAFQLDNELKMENDFSHLLYYNYINYIMEPKNYSGFMDYFKNYIQTCIKKDAKVENVNAEEFKKNIESIKNDKNIEKIREIIKIILHNHDTTKLKLSLTEDNFKSNNVESCLNDIQENNEDNNEDNEDDENNENNRKKTVNLADQTNPTIIILYYFYLFKAKKIKTMRSDGTKKILEYFTIQNMNRKFNYKLVESKLKELENQDNLKKKINDAITNFNNFFEYYKKEGIYKNQIDCVKNAIKPIINNLKTSKYFYIPLIGVYNSGKSTILNNLIGYDLLPVKAGECTKKGILIVNWEYDYPIIRKAKFVCENTGEKNDICYCEFNNDVIAEGDDNVRTILMGVNGNFIEKEEDFFYIINVKIKYLDNFSDNSLKEKICFVDLPGYGTNNKFETKDIYSKFIKNCKLFIMISKDHFSDTNNVHKIKNLIDKIAEYQKISKTALSKKILFIINNSKNLDTSEKNLLDEKQALIKNLGLNDNVNKDINITFFNGLFYQYYLENKKYFSNLGFMIESTIQKHMSDREKLYKGYSNSNCEKKFENYFLRNLKENFNEIFNISNVNNLKIDIDKETDDSMNAIITQKKLVYKEKDLEIIKKVISYGKSNIEHCKFISQSNYLNFDVYLKTSIIISKYQYDEELKKLIENNLNDLSKIFRTEDLKDGEFPIYKISHESISQLSEFKANIENKISNIEGLYPYRNNIPKIFGDSIAEMNKILKELKKNIEQDLKNKKSWKVIQAEFEQKFQSTLKAKKEIIIKTLENCSDEIKSILNQAFEIINNFKNSQDKREDDIEELKTYLSNKLGERNEYKEAIDNIINDVVSSSKTATNWKNSSGLIDFIKTQFSNKVYLDKTIDSIITNSNERLEKYKMNIDNLILEYQDIILNKIKIEKLNIENLLEERKMLEEAENAKNFKLKAQYEAKMGKWKKVCEKYEEIKSQITEIFKGEDISKTEEIVSDNTSETPTPK